MNKSNNTVVEKFTLTLRFYEAAENANRTSTKKANETNKNFEKGLKIEHINIDPIG